MAVVRGCMDSAGRIASRPPGEDAQRRDRLREALSLCRPGGTVTLFAHAPEGAFADFDLNELFKHEKRIIGTYSGSLKEQAETFSLLESGRLDPSPLVTHKLPLDSFEEGVRLAREHEALKVLFLGKTN